MLSTDGLQFLETHTSCSAGTITGLRKKGGRGALLEARHSWLHDPMHVHAPLPPHSSGCLFSYDAGIDQLSWCLPVPKHQSATAAKEKITLSSFRVG